MNTLRLFNGTKVVPQRSVDRMSEGQSPTAHVHGQWILSFVLIGMVCGVNHNCVQAQNAIQAESVSAQEVPSNANSNVPNITGVWLQVNNPDSRMGFGGDTEVTNSLRVYITPALAGSSYQFQQFLTAQGMTSGAHITWLPKQKLFEVSDVSHAPSQKFLLEPMLERKQIKTYSSAENNIDWASTLDQLANPETAADARQKFKVGLWNYRGLYDRIESDGLILTETAEGLAAYSKILGRWDRIEVPKPTNGSPRIIHCRVNAQFAAAAINDQLIGFGSALGRWTRKTIPPDSIGRVTPVLSENTASVEIGDKFYTLAPTTGEWTSPDEVNASVAVAPRGHAEDAFKPAQPDQPEVPEDGVLFFHASWAGPSVQIVPAVNALIKLGLPLRIIDIDQNKQMANQFRIEAVPTFVVMSNGKEIRRETRALSREKILELLNAAHAPSVGKPVATASSVLNSVEARQLSERLANQERFAALLAEQLRNQSNTAGNDLSTMNSLRSDLAKTLSAALDLKFELEELQVSELQSQLRRLQEQIGHRKAQRQKIIERRINELVEGDATRWSSLPEGGISSSASPILPKADTNSGSPLPKRERSSAILD